MKYVSPRFAILFLLLLLGLGFGGWFWYSSIKIAPKEVYFSSDQKTFKARGQANQDLDQDGLKDWEEVLWETSSQNPDTDGDGTPDGEEVRQKRNPLVKGPGDEYRFPEGSGLGQNDRLKTNFTDQVARAFANALGPRLIPKNGRIAIGSEEPLPISQSLPNPDALLGPIPEIKKSELTISPHNDPASVKKYFNYVYGVYEKTFLTLENDDLTILVEALTTNDFSDLRQIDAVVRAFERSFDEVKKIAVPAGYEDFALKELFYLEKSKRIVQRIQTIEHDPLAALAMIQRRIDLMREIRKFHLEAAEGLSKKGVTFSPGEGGYKFFE